MSLRVRVRAWMCLDVPGRAWTCLMCLDVYSVSARIFFDRCFSVRSYSRKKIKLSVRWRPGACAIAPMAMSERMARGRMSTKKDSSSTACASSYGQARRGVKRWWAQLARIQRNLRLAMKSYEIS